MSYNTGNKMARRPVADIIANADKVLTEESAKEILIQYGIKVPDFILVTNENDASTTASKIGFPLVAKAISPEIFHKTDVKGVRLGLNSEEEVKEAFNDMYERLLQKYNLKGVILEQMVPPGIELIVGLQNDRQFGPVIMIGLGGIYTEILKDVSFRVLPITQVDAIEMIEDLKGKQLLKGFRGSEPIDVQMLSDLLVNIGKLGIELAPYYESIDLNPIIVYAHDYFAVDAKIILKSSPNYGAFSTVQPDLSYIDLFFNAKSIALIGASPEIGRVGNSILRNLVNSYYRGKVFPVNAEGCSEIMGIKAYKSLEEITEPLDVVLVTVDLRFVPDLLKICGRKNIHNMIIFSGGGKELGGEGAILEQKIRELARKLKVRIIGPNCVGMFNNENDLNCVFQGYRKTVRPKKGHISFISQSGTMAAAFMETASHSMGISKMISYGNRSDVDEADFISYLSNDPQTHAIGIYFEGVGDGRKFINTAKKVINERGKPIVVFKNNRTPKAAKQSALHNGSLVSSYDIIKGVLDQAGIISVDSYEELVASLRAISCCAIPKGNRVALVTNGGAAVVAALDHIERLGLQIAEISEETKNALREHYPPTYVSRNPCDLTCVASSEDYKFAIEKFMKDPNVDIVMSWFVPWFVFEDNPLDEKIVNVLASLQNQNNKPLLVGVMGGGPFIQKVSSQIEDRNVPVCHSITTWVTAAAALAKCSKVVEQKDKDIDIISKDNLGESPIIRNKESFISQTSF
jgi:3-hydroxypropionyl-CoA synthetase (ADP-forming)